ncbi:MAG: bacteriorhodopsin [Janthinobacterium lividum]
MTESAWFWVGTVGMGIGALVLFLVGKHRTHDEEAHTVVHVVVTVVAACSYLAMAFGQGGLERDGSTLWYVRYLDWTITTPLLLLGLAMTALHGAHRRPALVAAVLGADALMIVTGLLSGLSLDPTHRLAWFLVSTGAFLAVYASLFGPLRTEAALRDGARRHAYGRNAVILAVLWLVYPVVVALGPHGAGEISNVTETGWIVIVDLLAKVAYGLVFSHDSKIITDGDLVREGQRS